MICLICRQAETIDRLTSVSLERGEMKFVVNHVPARICPSCGESYVDETVAERLLLWAEQRWMDGEMSDRQEYESLK